MCAALIRSRIELFRKENSQQPTTTYFKPRPFRLTLPLLSLHHPPREWTIQAAASHPWPPPRRVRRPRYSPCPDSELIAMKPTALKGFNFSTPSVQNQIHELAKTLPPPRKQNTACDACRCAVHSYMEPVPTLDDRLCYPGLAKSSAINYLGRTRYILSCLWL